MTLTQCPHCHLDHADPCDDTRKLECLIYQAQQKLAQQKQKQQQEIPAITLDPANPNVAAYNGIPTQTPPAPPAPPAPPSAPPVDMEALVAAVTVQPPLEAVQRSLATPAPAVAPAPAPAAPAAPTPVSAAINPSHYTRFKIQPIQFARENGLMFWQANVIKYVLRADAKNGMEDIDKGIDFLMKERAYLAGDPNWMDVRWEPPTAAGK